MTLGIVLLTTQGIILAADSRTMNNQTKIFHDDAKKLFHFGSICVVRAGTVYDTTGLDIEAAASLLAQSGSFYEYTTTFFWGLVNLWQPRLTESQSASLAMAAWCDDGPTCASGEVRDTEFTYTFVRMRPTEVARAIFIGERETAREAIKSLPVLRAMRSVNIVIEWCVDIIRESARIQRQRSADRITHTIGGTIQIATIMPDKSIHPHANQYPITND